MTEQQHTCPRRAESGRDNPDSPFHGSGTNLDTWRTSGGLVGQGHVGLSCSYCGSLHPDRFMELVRAGWVVGPTDKSYKAYLGQLLTAEELTQRKTAWVDRMAIGPDGEEQQRAEWERAYDRDHEHPQSGGDGAKFYFQHLSIEQQDEFIGLHNAKQIKFGYPGGFYVAPFFAQRQPPETGGE